MPEPTPRRPRHVEFDLSGVLLLLLIGSFVLILVTVGYGFATGKLSPAVVLSVAATLFSGVLAGALAGGRSKKEPPPGTPAPPPEEGESP